MEYFEEYATFDHLSWQVSFLLQNDKHVPCVGVDLRPIVINEVFEFLVVDVVRQTIYLLL
jgi:hypothetical protein